MDGHEFKIGDRVVCTRNHPDGNKEIIIGSTGTVCYVSGGKTRVGIRWDEITSRGHSCNENCDYGYGWYVDACDVELFCMAEDDSEISFDEESFNSFLLEMV